MRHTIHTPGCDGIERPLFTVRDRNRRIGSEDFLYVSCETCGLVRLDTIPANLGEYYPTTYYDLPTVKELESLGASDLSKISTVRQFVTSGRLLEIGPAQGTFALQAKRAGFLVDTIEMDERCCEHLNAVVGVRAIRSDAPESAMESLGSYDVIALWHVIEHLQDPWAVMRAAARHCAPGGIIVVAAPNPEAWQFRLMNSHWPHVDAPRHLYLLPRAVLKNYLGTLGFRVLHDTTADDDAKRWNRFGWQRLLMNHVNSRPLRGVAWLLGYLWTLIVTPFETRQHLGSAYTLVYAKERGCP